MDFAINFLQMKLKGKTHALHQQQHHNFHNNNHHQLKLLPYECATQQDSDSLWWALFIVIFNSNSTTFYPLSYILIQIVFLFCFVLYKNWWILKIHILCIATSSPEQNNGWLIKSLFIIWWTLISCFLYIFLLLNKKANCK